MGRGIRLGDGRVDVALVCSNKGCTTNQTGIVKYVLVELPGTVAEDNIKC